MTEAARSPATPGAAGTRAPLPNPTRDFTDDQKESFRSLAASMSFVGVCLMLFGGLLAVFAFVAFSAGFPWGAAGLFALAAAYGPTGWWTTLGGRSLSGIVRTRGGDVDHLMEAVVQLRRLFAFARAAIIVQTLIATAVAGGFVWCTILADKGTRCYGIFGF
jgi:hypothetical protein